MRNVYLVIKHEIITTLQKRSFWIMAFLFPLVIVGINVGAQLFVNRPEGNSLVPAPSTENAGRPMGIGYVDRAGLIEEIPADLPQGLLQAFPNEEAARAAVEDGQVDEYVIIAGDYLQSGNLVVVQRNFQPLGSTPEDMFKYVIDSNLTGNTRLAAALSQTAQQVEMHSLAPDISNTGNDPLTSLVPMAVLSIFFFLLLISSGFMLRSVSREKENRIVEILLLSLRPRELMLGKILGLSLVALLQMAVWIGGGLLVLGQGKEMLSGAAAFELPAGFVIWTVLYFLLGYLLYASLMGAIGAMAPNARESGQFTLLVLLPLTIPWLFRSIFIQTPNSPLSLALSLFPLTAPTSMITRLVATHVPLWQITASLAGLAVTTFFLVQLSARFFRADTLLSSSAINWQRISGVLQSGNVK
ncbi:MAG: ABC transporter permease [Anaerolineales bacterium]|jgi:ABC-2 type transport system permease protein